MARHEIANCQAAQVLRIVLRHSPTASLKTNTARMLRRDFAKELGRWYSQPVLWSQSYCAIGVGGAPLEVLKRCIEQQDRPH